MEEVSASAKDFENKKKKPFKHHQPGGGQKKHGKTNPDSSLSGGHIKSQCLLTMRAIDMTWFGARYGKVQVLFTGGAIHGIPFQKITGGYLGFAKVPDLFSLVFKALF